MKYGWPERIYVKKNSTVYLITTVARACNEAWAWALAFYTNELEADFKKVAQFPFKG